nr:uncharacterized protein LOC100001930 [Danio rerio]|eukprot:XP_021327857.1 uncharacterized protein LOC100001930 [Danio rerio]
MNFVSERKRAGAQALKPPFPCASCIALAIKGLATGFSFLHIAVLFFCFAAGSGDVLLLSFLIHCRLKNTVSSSTIWSLQLSLILFPNLCMFLAFILWGFTEGSLYETITCSSLYILRPFMLIWVLPYLKYLQDKLKRWIEFFTATRELCFFTLIVYSVFFMHGWRIREHHTDLKPLTMSGMFYGLLVLISVVLSTVFGCKFLDSHFLISMMSAFQLPQLFFLFGYTSLGTGIFVVLAVIHTFWPFVLRLPAVFDRFCRTWIVALWIIAISVLEIILAIYIHILMLEREKVRIV